VEQIALHSVSALIARKNTGAY